MYLYDKQVALPFAYQGQNLLTPLRDNLCKTLKPNETPVRFVITESDSRECQCELAVLVNDTKSSLDKPRSLFQFQRRSAETIDKFNAVLLIPTGIDCAIGGHAGDATPVARLLASVCDTLIVHPNVVNASDINEAPDNCLYVEGSIICRLLMGVAGLRKVRANRVLMLVQEHETPMITEASMNAVSAARATLGLNCAGVVRMNEHFTMGTQFMRSGRASGRIDHFEQLITVLERWQGSYDAVGIASVINTPKSMSHFTHDYYVSEMLNPWGGVEAMLTHTVSSLFNVPSAHSPMMETSDLVEDNVGVIDPRKAAEIVSKTYLHCILKGLHRSPKIVTGPMALRSPEVLSAKDISCLVIPEGCLGLPTLAALEQEIPVIAVRENTNLMRNSLEKLPFRSGKYFIVDNYLEVAGLMNALKAGIAPSALRRPIPPTQLYTHNGSSLPVTADHSSAVTE